MISIIAAIGENRELGKDNNLLWHLPNDMKRFKNLTTGHTVIMGRKTFESLPKGALPNRKNVVITKNKDACYDNCLVYNSLEEAIRDLDETDELFIIGGASIYGQSIKYADKLYITSVHHTFKNADTFFPEITEKEWIKVANEDYDKDGRHEYFYTFETFLKKK
jgi:dihydrofolate reductase